MAKELRLAFKFKGREFHVELANSETICTLKSKLYEKTKVPVSRQKLLGFKKRRGVAGHLSDDSLLSDFVIGKRQKFILIGTIEEEELKKADDVMDVFNDFDLDYMPTNEEIIDFNQRQANLDEKVKKTEINLITPLRPGKKLLVLDLDYTLFDFGSRKHVPKLTDTMRPGLIAFMTEMYKHYDIVIWSQTSWRWLEVKITELGFLTHPSFSIAFVLDKTSMPKVKTRFANGRLYSHECKPLGLIWAKLPQYGPQNTVHVDDLSRNFAMNPSNGVKIKAFKNSAQARLKDKELLKMTKYLVAMASEPDISKHDHKAWKHFVNKK